jgi:formamidopyrimidine-DNA glycosylase
VPELPEVETTRRGIAPHLIGQSVARVLVREPRLRWRVTAEFETALRGEIIRRVDRRAKYLLILTDSGTVLLHLGMSGNLRVLPSTTPPKKHDHVDIELGNGHCLRLNDPRRFGAVLWTEDPAEQHPLLRHLGPEPLGDEFTANYLHEMAGERRTTIKSFLMDNRVVVGVGNIYANEALFIAGIHPLRMASRVAHGRYSRLVDAVQAVLSEAINRGGTTLRDFKSSEGKPGYFQQYLQVYGRSGQPCLSCGKPVRLIRVGQRATYYCAACQH